ncbi:hypothetical protein ACFL0Y_00610 [Patescibacteria group bacterium]
MIKNKGIVLLEVLMAAALLGVILVPALNFLVASVESSWFASREVRAQGLAREAVEALRSVRERNWAEMIDGVYSLDSSGGVWQLVPDADGEEIDTYNRQVLIEPVYRDDQGQIVSSGGTLDLATKVVTVNVAWEALRQRTFSLTTYLTRHLDNLVWTQTTQAEFDLGEKEFVETTQVDDGEVQLEGGCSESPDGPILYDELFYNTWVVHPSGKNDIREITSLEGEVYEGEKALELINFNGADTKLRNVQSICTLGFTRFEFWVYSTAETEQSFGIHGEWGGTFQEIVIPSQEWHFVSLAYAEISGDNEVNLDFLFFKPMNVSPGTILYLDNMTLAGGVGGYYLSGALYSSVFDAHHEIAFNRISYNAFLPLQTSVGLQVATSNNPAGPWVYYGPGGTTGESDLYSDSDGEGIWLGNNFGQYCRYKAYLFSDGQETPILYDVSLNYSP